MSAKANHSAESTATPEVIDIARSAEQAEVKLLVPENLIYFRGHFPGFALLPGVIQVDWAVRYGKELFLPAGAFPSTIRIKFRRPIRPNYRLSLNLKFVPLRSSVHFEYSDAEGPYSSGQIGFASE